MKKIYYCSNCKRVTLNEDACEYCKGENLLQLRLGRAVNVIGSKVKGELFKVKDDKVELIIKDQISGKIIKEYAASELKKVL